MSEIAKVPENFRSNSLRDSIIFPSDKTMENKQAAQSIMQTQRERIKGIAEIDDSNDKKRKGRRKEQDQHEKE